MFYVMSAFARKIGTEVNTLHFLANGARIHLNDTSEDLDIEDGQMIDYVLEQRGEVFFVV